MKVGQPSSPHPTFATRSVTSESCQFRTAHSHVSSPAWMERSLLALFELQDERAKLRVRRIKAHQFPGVKQGCRKVSIIPRDRDEWEQVRTMNFPPEREKVVITSR